MESKPMYVCTPGYPMAEGGAVRAINEAFLVKASLVVDTHAMKPLQRERITAVAAIAPAPVQTTALPSISSALTRERRT
ncbi:hypothetical protein [Actinophytocola sediminis]